MLRRILMPTSLMMSDEWWCHYVDTLQISYKSRHMQWLQCLLLAGWQCSLALTSNLWPPLYTLSLRICLEIYTGCCCWQHRGGTLHTGPICVKTCCWLHNRCRVIKNFRRKIDVLRSLVAQRYVKKVDMSSCADNSEYNHGINKVKLIKLNI